LPQVLPISNTRLSVSDLLSLVALPPTRKNQ